MFRIYLVILACLFTFSTNANKEKKVLIIGIDGCRPDALMKAYTPNIDTLLSNSTYSLDALTKPPTVSATGWSSILTGVWGDKHGATDHNNFGHTHYDKYPDIFKFIEDYNPNLNTASLVVWNPINDKIVNHADFEKNFDKDSAMAEAVAKRIENGSDDVMFIHFDDVDHSGHSNGFDPSIKPYIQTIEATDVLIGKILKSMRKRPNFKNEEWLIMVTPDHGGTIKGSHGGKSFEERNIFFIASGDKVKNKKIEKVYNNSTKEYDFSKTPRIVDVPATVLAYLGIPLPAHFDGKSRL
ncbi:MAG: hypothetical protein CR986_03070 [Ignavibacteriae bacterium]|nr:MAG: hypothetical protein CR986_03070 [Ignavibacteriota bacterium]